MPSLFLSAHVDSIALNYVAGCSFFPFYPARWESLRGIGWFGFFCSLCWPQEQLANCELHELSRSRLHVSFFSTSFFPNLLVACRCREDPNSLPRPFKLNPGSQQKNERHGRG